VGYYTWNGLKKTLITGSTIIAKIAN